MLHGRSFIVSFSSLCGLLLLMCPTVSAGDDAELPNRQQELEEFLQRMREMQPERRLTTQHPPVMKAVRELFLPRAILADDLERYARIMRLSEEQAEFLRIMHEQYVIENTALKENRLEDLWMWAIEMAGSRVLSDPVVAQEQRNLYAARNDYVQRMASIERRFFDRIEPVLTDEQQFAMERVRLLRARDRYPFTTIALYGARVDPTLLIDRLERQPDFLVTDRQPFVSELLEYERQLTNLRRQCWEAQVDGMTRGVELLVERRFTQDEAKRRELLDARSQIIARAGRVQIRIADLNHRTVDRLIMHLSEAGAELLRDAYLAEAYPRIFPNYHCVDHVLDAALQLEDLPEETMIALHSLAVKHRHDVDRLNREMMQLSWKYGEFIALTRRSGGQAERTFKENLKALRMNRERAGMQVLDDIQTILPTESHAAIAQIVEAFRTGVDSIPRHAYQPHRRIHR